MMPGVVISATQAIKAGKLRALAALGPKRVAALPDLPTVQEQGVAGFEVTGWFGLFAPAKTPTEVVQRLNAEINRVMALPELREKLVLLGSNDVPTLSPEGFGAFVNAETARYAAVVKSAGVSLALPAQ